MLFLSLSLVFMAAVMSTANSPSKNTYETDLFDVTFPDGEASFNKTLLVVFSTMDSNSDGHVSVMEFYDFHDKSRKILGNKTPVSIDGLLQTGFQTIDKDNDGMVSFAEFKESVRDSLKSVRLTVNSPICAQAKKVLDTCVRRLTHPWQSLTTTISRADAKTISDNCVNGYNGVTHGYKTEECLVNSGRSSNLTELCPAAKQCVTTHFKRSSKEATGLDLMEYDSRRHTAKVLKILGFSLAGASVLGMLVGLDSIAIPVIAVFLGFGLIMLAIGTFGAQTLRQLKFRLKEMWQSEPSQADVSVQSLYKNFGLKNVTVTTKSDIPEVPESFIIPAAI